LLFTTLCLDDPTEGHIRETINCISQLDKNELQLPETWRRIVLTFSGHGDEDYLYTKDGHVKLREDMVNCLQAISAEQLASIPKLFFIDACRGSGEDEGVAVPVSIDLSWFEALSDNSDIRPRGGGRVPSRGNSFIAYSTMLGMQSYESRQTGGFWMQTLAEQLTNPENFDKTILDVMTRVNRVLVDTCSKIQQPICKSTLTEDIKLLREAAGNQWHYLQYCTISCICCSTATASATGRAGISGPILAAATRRTVSAAAATGAATTASSL
jgi:hypothetical protein